MKHTQTHTQYKLSYNNTHAINLVDILWVDTNIKHIYFHCVVLYFFDRQTRNCIQTS